MAINPYEAIEIAKNKYPDAYIGQTDKDIYNDLKRRYPKLSFDKPDWEDNEYDGSTGGINDVDDSPGMISTLLLGNANELLTDKYDWAKRNYNNSLAGNIYKMMYGKSKYKVEDIPNEWYQDAAGFFMSIVNPLEMGLFAFSGGTAKVAAGPVSRLLAKEGFKKGVFEGTKKTASRKIKDKAFGHYMMKEATVHNALQMGTYSGAHGAVARYGQQSLDIKEGRRNSYSHGEVLLGSAGDFTTGLALGAAGGVVKSAMANKFARASRGIGKLKKTGEPVPSKLAAQRIATHPLGQVMAEANVFTAGHLASDAIISGHMPTWEDYFKGLAMNTAIVGGMRTGTKFGRRGSNDVSRYYKTKMAFQKEARAERNIKSLQEVAKAIEEQGGTPNKELLEEASRLELQLIDSKSEKSDIIKAAKRYAELESKENLSSKEQAELVETGALMNSWYINFYEGLKTGEGFEAAKEMYAKELGVEVLNKKQEASVSKIIKNNQNELIKKSIELNDRLKGIEETKEVEAPKIVSKEDVKVALSKKNELELLDIAVARSGRSLEDIKLDFKSPIQLVKGVDRIDKGRLLSYIEELGVPSEIKSKLGDAQRPWEQSGLLEGIREMLGLADVSKAKKDVSKIRDIDVANIGESEKGAWNFINRQKEGAKNFIEPVSENTNAIIVDYLKANDKSATSGKHISDLLKFSGKKEIRDITFKNITDFTMDLAKTSDTISGPMSSIANVFNHASARGFMPRLPYTKEQMKKLWNKSNEMIKARAKVIKKAVGDIAEEVGGMEGAPKYISLRTKSDLEANIAGRIHLKEGFGLRISEVNKLKPKHLIKDGEYHAINLPESVAKSYAREVPITKELYSDILSFIKQKGIKDSDLIFSKDAPAKVLKMTGLGQKLKARGIKQQLDLFARKLAESSVLIKPGLTEPGKSFLKSVMGHEKWSDKVYGIVASEKQIRLMNKNARDLMDGKVTGLEFESKNLDILGVKQRKVGARPEGEIIFKGKGADKARKDFIKKVAKKNNVTEKELREANLDEGVLGTFVEGDIKLAKGVFQPADYYHENLHRLKRFAKVTGNKKLSKLIERGEKLGKGTKEYKEWAKKNKGRDMEEFLGDISGGKASKMEFSKGMLPKLKQFVKQLTSQVKVALGMGNFKDISNVLAGKVRKGFDTKGVDLKGGKIKYKKQVDDLSTAKKVSGDLKSSLRAVMKKLNFKDETSIVNYIKDMAGIEGKFKIHTIKGIPEGVEPSIHLENLQKFKSTLDSIGAEKIRRDVDVRKKFKTVALIGKTRRSIDIDITAKEQKRILESLGVEKGNEWRATQEQLNDYLDILHSSRTTKYSDNKRVDNIIALNLIKDKEINSFIKGKTEISKFMMPVRFVLKKLGLIKLHDALTDHVSIEAGHLGAGYDKFVTDVKAELGRTPITRDRAFDKMKHSLHSVDAKGQRLLDSIEFLKNNRDKLTKSERKTIKEAESFFNKAIKKEWFKTVKDGKGDNLRAKENGKYKYLNLESKEGKVVEKYIDFTDYYKAQVKEVFRKVMTKTEYEDFVSSGGLKWVEDGIFVTRQTTKEAKKLLNLDSKQIQKVIEDSAYNYAKERAKEHFKTESPSAEQINQFYDEAARTAAYADLQNASSFALNRITSKHLLKRYAKLPEFIEDPNTGKLVRVYETSFDATVTRYGVGMSKFLAGVEVFPEFAKIKGFKGVNVKGELGKIREKSSELADYVEDIINIRIGVGKSNPFEVSSGAVQIYANVLAKIGLSGPTSGMKNIITGAAGLMYAQKLGYMGKGLADVIRGEGRAMTKTGGQVVGMSHYEEPGKVTSFLDKTLFRLGGMRITEKFNRNWSQLTAKYDQRALFQVISDGKIKQGSKKYDKAYKRLRDFYELPKEQIELVKKYGFENVNLKKEAFASTRDYVIEKRNLENAYQKMNTMAHIKTQGAALDIFSPKWASGKYIKPLLLYKRMAYAATINTKENIQLAYKSGDYGKIIVGTMGTYFGGAALMGVYWHMLGTPMPKENSPAWKNIMTTMWKGEFLGILSEWFSPYDSTLGGSIAPAIYQNLGAFLGSASSVWKGEKYLGQGIDDYARRSVSAYNAYTKVIEKRNNPYNRDMLRVNKLYKQFEDEVMKEPNAEYEATVNTKYFRDLQNAFNLGNEKEFAKSLVLTYYALASDYYNRGYAEHPDGVRRVKSLQDAFKKASSTLERKMKALNPNPATFGKKRYAGKARAVKFRNWLSNRTIEDKQGTLKGRELEKRMLQLETEYKNRMKKNMKALPYHFRQLNLKSLMNEFDWIHKL